MLFHHNAEGRRFELLKPVKTCYLSKVVH